VNRKHMQTTCRRGPRTVALTVLIAGLALGWSCQPGPAQPTARVDLVKWAWLDEVNAILLVTSVEEADPFRTHGRLELSWLDGQGRELFRAFYNTSSRANPAPPEAFGVFNLEDDTFESAGIDAYMEVALAGFTFLTDSEATRQNGVLSVAWAIRPPDSLTDPIELRARLLPKRSESGEWAPLGRLEFVDGTWQVEETEGEASRETAFNGRLPAPFSIMFEEGDPTAALRALTELWDEGGDPRTIRAIRTRALREIGEAGSFATGSDSYKLADIRMVYEWMLMSPDVLHFRLPVVGDLAPERLLYLAIAIGTEHAEPASRGGEYVLPDIDFPTALGSADPWLVSAALFMARKQDLDVDIGDLLMRWQGSNAWDETCTEQALLYLASRPAADLAQSFADVPELPPEVAGLADATENKVEIQALLFLSSGEWDPALHLLEPGKGLVIEVRDSTMEVITERPATSDTGTLELSPTRNYYSFRYLDGPMHGESRFIDGVAGTFVRMAVAIQGGV
jgi:hypothetical protein